ncbi:MAG TPA: hypothetical protein DCQ37_00630 [Desulfobacteraceae bacterium]|nr:hypothetical protein [Desulfobacteraceae bacterium]
MNFKLYLETAWKLTIKYIAPLILMTLVMGVASVITLGFLAPVMMAGYMQAVLLMIRNGREPVIQDVFSQMKLFFPLLGFGIAVFILIMMGLMMFILPGILISLAISFICLYMLPLMTDKQKGIIEALKESFAITTDKEKFSDHLIVAILITGIYMVGGYTYIGWIFTLPFSTVFLMLIYEEQVNRMPMQPMYQAEPPEQNNA